MSGSLIARKSSKIVCLIFNLVVPNEGIANNVTIQYATLPSGYRPVSSIVMYLAYNRDYTHIRNVVYNNSSGDINIENGSTSLVQGWSLQGSISYIAS